MAVELLRREVRMGRIQRGWRMRRMSMAAQLRFTTTGADRGMTVGAAVTTMTMTIITRERGGSG